MKGCIARRLRGRLRVYASDSLRLKLSISSSRVQNGVVGEPGERFKVGVSGKSLVPLVSSGTENGHGRYARRSKRSRDAFHGECIQRERRPRDRCRDIMPPKQKRAVALAVRKVLKGMSVARALLETNNPCGERNLRKHVARARQSSGGGPSTSSRPNVVSGKARVARRNSRQVSVDNQAHVEKQKVASEAFKEATTAYSDSQRRLSAEAVAKAANVAFELTPSRQITSRRIRNAVQQGRAGASPVRRGPKALHPKAVLAATSALVSLKQAHGGTSSSRDVKETLLALTNAKALPTADPTNRANHLLKRLKSECVNMNHSSLRRVEAHRYDWADHDKYSSWFDDWREFALKHKIATRNADGGISFSETIKRRIINMDETELSFCASKRGGKHPQNNVIVNSSLPQPGHRGTKAMCSHTTGVFITSAAGEVGPVFIIESSRAKEVDKRHIHAEMLLGLPRVVAQFGHAEPQTFEATIASTTNGSMETGLWGQYLDACVYPLFPDLSPNNPAVLFVDGGPGRLENIDALIKAQRAGLHIFPLFPNGSAYAQPNDQIYGTLKLKIYHKMDKLEREKGVSLSRRSLGEILNGTPEDPLNDRPFSSTFTRTNILSAWQAVGAVPFTRASLRNAPLRDPSSAAGTLQELNKHLSECEALGIDVSRVREDASKYVESFDAPRVAPPLLEDTELQKIVSMRRPTSGALFAAVGAKPLTCPTVLAGLLLRKKDAAQALEAKNEKILANHAHVAKAACTILEAGKEDASLSSQELDTLLKCGPRAGLSALKSKAAKLGRWMMVKDDEPWEPSVDHRDGVQNKELIESQLSQIEGGTATKPTARISRALESMDASELRALIGHAQALIPKKEGGI